MKDFSDLKILVIDDSELFLKNISQMLKALGAGSVESFLDPALAIERISSADDYNFIVSDHNMPNYSGLDVLMKLREKFTKNEVPFILVTADESRENIMNIMSLGANTFIIKPPSRDRLEDKISEILKNLK